MATRTHAREMVVELLYAYAMGNERIFDFADELLNAKKIRNAQADFAKGLFNGVVAHLQNIDSIIEANLKSWELSRLGVIDKCILRLGAYEILKGEIDAPVAINEAIEIAKILGAENTGKFVNGVLDAISKGGFDLTKGVESAKNSSLGASFTRIADLDSNDSSNSKVSPSLVCGDSKNSPSLAEGARGWVKHTSSVRGSGKDITKQSKQKKRAFGKKGSKKQIYLPNDSNKKAKPIKSQNSRKDSKDSQNGLPRFAKGKSRNDKSISKPTKRTRNDNIKSAKSTQKRNTK